ncbi:unnamed protein product, partial [Ectocarpus fasciculatus]
MTSDTVFNAMGLIGCTLMAAAALPQVYRVTVRKKAADISYVYQV